MTLKVKLLSEKGRSPKRASASSAGLDLFSPMEVTIKAGESYLLPLAIAV